MIVIFIVLNLAKINIIRIMRNESLQLSFFRSKTANILIRH